MELVRGHHSVGEANFHLQFTLKYRRDIFRDQAVKEVCQESFHGTAEGLGLLVHALEFGPNHVHFFMGAYKNHSVAEIVRRLKGASSRRVRREGRHRIRNKLWGKAFWSGGYFYRSVGSTTSEAIQYYVDRGQEKHWTALDYEEYKHRKNRRQTKHRKTLRQTTLSSFTV